MLEVELHLGRSIKVEASKNGESMWTYETLREDKSNPNAIVWEANSKMTLNPASKLHKFIQDNYPFGAFQTRTNNFKLFIDRHNRNFLLRKFKINFDVVKDGNKVIDISGNTVDAPYQFSASAPNLREAQHCPEPAHHDHQPPEGKLLDHRHQHCWRHEAGRQAVSQRWHRRKEH